jgi:protein-tyrosine phosphatase
VIPVLNQLSSWLTDRLSNPARGFGAATLGEPTVFGARRPGFPFPVVSSTTVERWIQFMQSQQIRRVVCLLPQQQLGGYNQLLGAYKQGFGTSNVCWSPIHDFKLADANALTQVILPFLADADRHDQRVVVHCSGGVGRTGHILAAWLVSFRGLSNEEAIQAVRKTGRNPRESRDPALDQLLDRCRSLFAA